MKMHLARNKKGELRLFRWTPEYSESLDMWYEEHLEDGYGNMPDTEYPEITFENSPMEVELVIKSQNKVIECYNCHEVINFTEDDVIEGWYVKCPCCGEKISILP